MYSPRLDDLHTTGSGGDGAVAASGILAWLQKTHPLLNGHRTQIAQIKQVAWVVVHLYAWEGGTIFSGWV